MQQIRSVVGRIKTWGFVATVAMVTAIQPVRAEAPAALSMAPEGAQVIIIIPSISDFCSDLSMLNQTLGLDQPELTDALAVFKATLGINDGLNDAGSALLVIQNVSDVIQTQERPEMVLIMPVTNYQAFVRNYQTDDAPPAGEGTTQITLPHGQEAHVIESGGYAIMSNSENVATNYTPGGNVDAISERVGELGLGYLSESDLAVYVDIEAMAPALSGLLDAKMAGIVTQLDQIAEMGMVDESNLEMLKLWSTMSTRAAKVVVGSAEGFVFTLDINEHGIGFTDAIQFKADSPVMEFLPGGAGNLSSLLARLPRGSYVGAGALDTQAINCTALVETALAMMPEDMPGMDVYRDIPSLLEDLQQYAAVFYTPEPAAIMSNSGAMNMLATYKVDDSAEYLKKCKNYIESLNGASIPMAMPMMMGGQTSSMTYVTSYTENALQLDGVRVDQYKVQTQLPQEMLMMMGPFGSVMQMFSDIDGYAAEADGYYLATTTLDQQLMAQGIATGKTGDGMGAGDALARVREKAVPDGAVAEMYLNLGGVVEMLSPMAARFGISPIEAPKDLPPIAMGMGIKGNSAAGRLYIPNDTIKYAIETVKSVQSQLMGGQRGPGGPNTPQHRGPGAPPPPF